ncbi:DoxX family protein [Flavobacteriaceae bacterium]|nr:DoxX family protein [Flavobacteriaceae bacterium]
MNKITTHIGLLLLRVGFSVGLMTHGYGKLIRVWEGNFKFGDPIGIGSAPSLFLATFGEFIAPIFIIIGWKTKLFSIFPALTMLVAFVLAHDGDPFSKKEKAFAYLVAFVVIYLTGPGKYAVDKR